MRLSNVFGNILLLLFLMIMLGGCFFPSKANYDTFQSNTDILVGTSFIPRNWGEKHRQIYSEDRYIYIYQNIQKDVLGVILQIEMINQKEL